MRARLSSSSFGLVSLWGRLGVAFAVASQLSLATGGLLMVPHPAQAITEAVAAKKLAVIPVFVLTDEKGTPLPIPRDKDLILPLYLDRTKAESELAAFKKANPAVKAKLLPIPLNVANDKILELNKQLKDKKLLGAVIPRPQDRAEAVKLLKQQGLTDKAIAEGLSVPVFFTRPFLTLNTPQGPRGVFFFSFDALENALAKIPDRQKLMPQAADLSAVLREIIKQKDDLYVFFPTPEYFKLVQQQGGAAKTPSPVAPK
ncbi:Tic22 family protein [Cyanobium sp. Morenito 9A2]|uniref:Tic22 family protein n=1 Tax=Cyanobium sp. Morenito 9A2 TaxID=2823718 RepID=UPI0020CC53C1|nr:Tic22 family protein [Cyanobium sp. Morenito 9A2]MCP9849313.1 hypothetical protein [Cyanobium sp. Morenito 9A2]